MAPCRGSWDWSTHLRRSEDERERDDPWRNGGSVDDDRPNGRVADRRKTYQKPLDHISSRLADERGGSEGIRGNRDWHLQSSPQGMSFNSYRNVDDDFYMKEQMFKSDKMPRPSYQRHDTKSRRRDGGDYYGRMRHSEFEEPPRRTPEDKRQTSPSRGRSEKASRRHTTAEKHEKEKSIENTVSTFYKCNNTTITWHTHLTKKVLLFLRIATPKTNLVHPKEAVSQKSLRNVVKRKTWYVSSLTHSYPDVCTSLQLLKVVVKALFLFLFL